MLIDSRSILSNLISVKQAVQRVDARVADNHALASDIHAGIQNVHRHVLDSQESVQHVEEMVLVTRDKIDRVEAQLKLLTVSVVFLC